MKYNNIDRNISQYVVVSKFELYTSLGSAQQANLSFTVVRLFVCLSQQCSPPMIPQIKPVYQKSS